MQLNYFLLVIHDILCHKMVKETYQVIFEI